MKAARTRFSSRIALDPRAGRLYWADVGGIARIDPDQVIAETFEQILFIDGIQVTDLALFTTPGDFDRDGDVDLADVVTFQACFSGSGTTFPGATICYAADLDWDGDVDLADLLTFQAHFTGPK